MIGVHNFFFKNKIFFTKINQVIIEIFFPQESNKNSILKLFYVEKVLNKIYVKGNFKKKFPILLIV